MSLSNNTFTIEHIQVKRGTAAAWRTQNPVLASGEIGLETDTNFFKIGNGSTRYNSLPYCLKITDDLNNGTPTTVLSGQQGIVIKALIDAKPDFADIPTYTIIDDLSTGGSNVALSAAMGVVLNNKFANYASSSDLTTFRSNLTSEWEDFKDGIEETIAGATTDSEVINARAGTFMVGTTTNNKTVYTVQNITQTTLKNHLALNDADIVELWKVVELIATDNETSQLAVKKVMFDRQEINEEIDEIDLDLRDLCLDSSLMGLATKTKFDELDATITSLTARIAALEAAAE